MKVLVNGQLIEYKKEGRGQTVVLLHGWGTGLFAFDKLASHMTSQGYQVLRFDFPGAGASPKPDDSWGVGEYAKLTADLVKKLKISKVHAFVGHSFGGRVIIKGAANGILKADKFVLLAAAGVQPKSGTKKQAFKVVAKAGKFATSLPGMAPVREKLRNRLYQAAGSTDYLNAGAMQRIFLNTINEDLLPLASKIKQPVLMIWGEDDTETPLGQAKALHSAIKSSQLIVLPGAGHFVYDDAFGQVIKEIDGFLQ